VRLTGLARSIVPRPRRRISARTALPLALFMLLFAAACLLLEPAGLMLFTRPWAFLLSALLPWVWWMHAAGVSGLRGARSVLALVVRLTLVALFIVLLAEPRAVRKDDVLSVVYALDISDSIGESASSAALEYVTRTASGKPERDEAGLVVFGRDASVELPPRTAFPFESAIRSQILRDGTNLARGLSVAAAVLPDEHLGRIVLISDGSQTEGALATVLDQLKTRMIPVDVLPVRYEYQHEVWVERLELPRLVRTGETYEAAVVVSSLTDGTGRLALSENGRVICEQDVRFRAGKNRLVLPLYGRGPGYYEYAARIHLPEGADSREENNLAMDYLYLKGEGKVLVVTDPGPDAEPRDWQTLVQVLKETKRDVEVRPAYELPRDALPLLATDCVVLPNVPADAFDAAQLQALHDAVKSQGMGLLMVGGAQSFGPGGYRGTPVEEALPVSMDLSQKKTLPAGAIVFVLDRSGSMASPVAGTSSTQQQLANRATILAAQTLLSGDMVGVVAFDTLSYWIVPLERVEEVKDFAGKVWEIGPGGGTHIYPALRQAFRSLEKVDPAQAAVRHIILLSDGQTQGGDYTGIAQLMAGRGISLSSVAVGDSPNVDLLGHIAALTGGSLHQAADPRNLPKIFVKEALTLRRTMIQNETFTPTAGFPSPILKGITRTPSLHGHVVTMPKSRAMVVLNGPSQGEDECDPVLAVWRYGLGKAGAFTSDLAPNWGRDWVVWDRFRPFVDQTIGDIERRPMESNLQAHVVREGDAATILVDDMHVDPAFLEVQAVVQGPQGRAETVRLRQTGPQRYEGGFSPWGEGRYQVIGAGVGEGRTEQFVSGLVVPYSPEYLRFRADPITLARIAEDTGGRILTGDETHEDIFVPERIPKASSRSIADLFLLILAVLVPLDVAVRRVQLDWTVIGGWVGLGRGAEASGETFEALLRRKRVVESATVRKAPRAAVLPGRRKEGEDRTGPPPKRRERHAPPPDADRASTLKQLLDRKKKWKEE